EDLRGAGLQLVLQLADFVLDIERLAVTGVAQLLDLGFEFANRCFEFEEVRVHSAKFESEEREYNGSGDREAQIRGSRPWPGRPLLAVDKLRTEHAVQRGHGLGQRGTRAHPPFRTQLDLAATGLVAEGDADRSAAAPAGLQDRVQPRREIVADAIDAHTQHAGLALAGGFDGADALGAQLVVAGEIVDRQGSLEYQD